MIFTTALPAKIRLLREQLTQQVFPIQSKKELGLAALFI